MSTGPGASLAELQAKRQVANEGDTTEELRERFGWSVPRCAKIIRAALAAGKCRRREKGPCCGADVAHSQD